MNKRADRIATAFLVVAAIEMALSCVCALAGDCALSTHMSVHACFSMLCAVFVTVYVKEGR